MFPIEVPSLAERSEDIPELVESYSKKTKCNRANTRPKFDETALEELKKYNWPGNIREVRNIVKEL